MLILCCGCRRSSLQILWDSSIRNTCWSKHRIHHHFSDKHGVRITIVITSAHTILYIYMLMILYILFNRAIKRSNCFHKYGHDKGCHTLNTSYLLIFACIEIVLSQIPNFHKLSFLSIIATIMSFAYSTIGIGLSVAKITGQISFKLII